MANKLKTKKKPKPDPVDLRPEKEEKIAMQSLVKDERTRKIMGAFLLLLSIFMFIAFTSYLFTRTRYLRKAVNFYLLTISG
jgi:DNA segregation ATPase FtsK/SpoIIIE, S-DNA-T family